MLIEVELFAGMRDAVGYSRVTVALAAGSTVADLRQALAREYPMIRELLASSLMAADDDYVAESTPVNSAARWAVIPPVSGG